MKEPKTKLDSILRERGMSTKDLERELIQNDLKIEYYALTQYRNGTRKNMTIETLNKLCVALGVTPNDLVETDAVPVPHKKRYCDPVVAQVQDATDEYANEDDLGF